MINYNFGRLVLMVGLTSCFPYLLRAQENDIGLDVRYHPVSKYVPPMDSAAKVGSSRMVEYSASSHFSLYRQFDPQSGRVRLLSGTLFARQTTLNHTGFNSQVLPDNLYSINAGISYYASMNKRWGYAIFLNSALNTDFVEVDYNDVFLTGGLQFIRQFSPTFRLGFGAIIHNNLGKPMFWPALSVYWNPGKRFTLDIRVPDEGNGLAYRVGVGYKVADHFQLGFAFKPQNISYDVEPREAIDNRLMNFWQLPFELSGTYRPGRISYTANAGFTALRSFAYGQKELKHMFTKYPYHGLATNFTVGLGLNYHF